MKVNAMTRLFVRASDLVRAALTQDVATQRALEKTFVDVSLRSRLWGV